MHGSFLWQIQYEQDELGISHSFIEKENTHMAIKRYAKSYNTCGKRQEKILEQRQF